MDYYPRTSEQIVQTAAICRNKTGICLENGGIRHGFGEGPERGNPDLDTKQINPEQHPEQKNLGEGHEKHDRGTIGARCPFDQGKSDEEGAEDPEHEAALLPAVECCDQIAGLQVKTGIVVDVEVLESVGQDEVHQQN